MAKIYAPNKTYCGISASVPFINGVGECDIPHIVDWFRIHGYKVVEEAKKKAVFETQDMPEVETEASAEIEPEVEESIEPDQEPTEAVNTENINYEGMTKLQLQDIADKRSIPYNSHTTKEQLISALNKE